MKAIINCAGKGTRLQEFSKSIPKSMVEINGKPLLYWSIKNLKEYGIKEICITVHYLSEKIIDYFGDGKEFDVKIIYSYEEELLGTGGALTQIEKFIDDDVIMLYGDVLERINYKKLLSFHKKNDALVTSVIHQSLHPEDSDLVEIDADSKLIKILKKPHSSIPKDPYNLAAVYVLSKSITSFLKLKTPFDIAHDLLPYILKMNGNIFCYNTEELIMDIGTPERLERAKRLFLL